MAETQVHVHVKPNEEHYGTSKYIKVNRITGEELPLPVQSGTLKYTGGNQSPTWENYDRDKMTVSGISEVNAGTYTAKFVLKKGFYWEDGTITPKEIGWVIEKADGYVNVSNDIIRVRKNKTEIIDIINNSGIVSVGEYDTEKMNISISNNQISINGLKAGEYSFDIEVAASNNYLSTTKTINVSITSDGEIYGVKFRFNSYVPTNGIRTEDAADFSTAQFYTSGTQRPPYYVSNPTSPFNDISPWKDMVIVEDPKYGILIKIPKFYYRILVDDGLEIQICNTKLEGFDICPICMDRNDGQGERDFAYIGAYPSLKTNGYKSQKGPKLNSGESLTIDQLRTKIHELGRNAYLQDGSAYWTILYLYLVEVATMNPNYSLMDYNGSWGYEIGCTDSAPYHSSIDDYRKYRGIELLSLFRAFYIDGIIDKGDGTIYTVLNPSDNLTGNNRVEINDYYNTRSNYYPKKWKLTNNPMMPIVGAESDDYYNSTSLGSISRMNSNVQKDYYFMSFFTNANLKLSSFNTDYWKVSVGRLMVLPDMHGKRDGYINCEDTVELISYDWIEIPITASGEWEIKNYYQDPNDLYYCDIEVIKENGKLKARGISGIGHYYVELFVPENDNYYEATKTIIIDAEISGLNFHRSYNHTMIIEGGDFQEIQTNLDFYDYWKGSKTYDVVWWNPSTTRNIASATFKNNNRHYGTVTLRIYEPGTFHLTVTNTNSQSYDNMTIIVNGNSEKHIYFNPNSISMNKGETRTITIQGYDSDSKYTYIPSGGTSGGYSIASWSNYKLNDGSPTFTLTADSYRTGTVNINIDKCYRSSMQTIETATLTVTVV